MFLIVLFSAVDCRCPVMLLIDVREAIGDTDRTVSDISIGDLHVFRYRECFTQLIAGLIFSFIGIVVTEKSAQFNVF